MISQSGKVKIMTKKSKNKHYKETLHQLQIELVKLQNHIIKRNDKILIIFEGRDAAGKDGTIKRITQHLSPRETRTVALGKPSDRDLSSWYFQRYTVHLPAAQEMVLFNRSWYNRAGVEKVMGFCTEDQYHEFLETVPSYEQMLVRSGIQLLKYYLDISRGNRKNACRTANRTRSSSGKSARSTRTRINTGTNTVWPETSCSPEPITWKRPGPWLGPTTKKPPGST